MLNSGVYLIYNKINGKRYIGAASDVNQRRRGHFSDLRLNKHGNPLMQKDFNEFGEDNFEFVVLRYIQKKEEY